MSWFFGAGLGFLLGGPLGAVVGGAVQHFTSGARDAALHGAGSPNRETVFVTYLVSIMTKIAMADGRVDRQEIETMRRFFTERLGYSGMELQYIHGLIEQTQRVNPDLRQVASSFRPLADMDTRHLLLDICYQIAVSDGHFDSSEKHELEVLAQSLAIHPEDALRIGNKYGSAQYQGPSASAPPREPDHYALFGVSRSASEDEIKKSYRQMAAQYHPDKVSHLGKELIDFANNKFLEINKAYEKIKKERGI